MKATVNTRPLIKTFVRDNTQVLIVLNSNQVILPERKEEFQCPVLE